MSGRASDDELDLIYRRLCRALGFEEHDHLRGHFPVLAERRYQSTLALSRELNRKV
jgi:hypothetical protein